MISFINSPLSSSVLIPGEDDSVAVANSSIYTHTYRNTKSCSSPKLRPVHTSMNVTENVNEGMMKKEM